MRQRPYHIAHLLPWPSVGGVECATLRIAQAVGDAEFRSTAFCLDQAPLVRNFFESAGFETRTYEPVPPSYRHPTNHLRESLRLAREFRRHKVDLVHCADMLASFYAATAGRLARIPVLCHIRVREDAISRRDQSFLRLVHKFAFVSQDTWKHFAYSVSPHRGSVIYDGIDIEGETDRAESRRSVCAEFGLPTDAKIIGMCARVAPQKDYKTLVEAARRVVAAHKNARFLIVGDFSSTPQYRAHYEKVREMLVAHGVAPFFVFTDFRRDVRRLLSAMDIFVLSTHREGLPLVILEAMAQGLPVIATNVDGIPEIVTHEQTGLLHAHENAEELAGHLLALLADEERAHTLGRAARTHVETHFSRRQFAMSMSDLYRDMLRR